MRIDSANYSSGIRNYVLWKVSRYLWALPSAANLDNALKSKDSFQKQLEAYAVIARSEAKAISVWPLTGTSPKLLAGTQPNSAMK